YRLEPHNPQGKNVTTLDDNTTQAALRLLMRLDRALASHGQADAAVRAAVDDALASLLRAQYPNGAWPQRFSQPPDTAQFPVLPASYPQSWDRTWPGTKYNSYYTFNDNALDDVIDVLLEAGRLYDAPKYRAAAERGGDFILLAQMPDPQPAWAQQYNAQMHPAWARKFEPPAVTGGESQSILRALLSLYRETGKQKYLDPIPRALDYLQASRLADGRLARFYELRTNKPLYFTRDYQLTYSDADMPTHYSFKLDSKLDRVRRDYERLRDLSPKKLARPAKPKVYPPSAELIARAKSVLASLDDQGRWLDRGRLKTAPGPDGDEPVIRSETFIKNVEVLSSYLAAAKSPAAAK
ncbi:MAG TPA: pectate lyase, partial [Pirellulales bacterium]